MAQDLGATLRVCLARSAEGAKSYRDLYGFAPRAQSPAALELAEETNYAVEGAWGSEPVAGAYSTAAVHLVVCQDGLEAMRRLFDEPPSTFGIVSVARGGLEAAARAWYLLDPAITVRERVARGITDRLHSLYEQTKYPSALESHERSGTRIGELLTAGQALGYDVAAPERSAPYVGVRRPYSTALAEQMLTVEDLGSVLYRYFSGVTHAEIGVLLQHAAVDGTATEIDGVSVVMVGLQPQPAIHLVAAAVLSHAAAFERFMERYGWPPGDWLSLTKTSMQTINQALTFYAKEKP